MEVIRRLLVFVALLAVTDVALMAQPQDPSCQKWCGIGLPVAIGHRFCDDNEEQPPCHVTRCDNTGPSPVCCQLPGGADYYNDESLHNHGWDLEGGS